MAKHSTPRTVCLDPRVDELLARWDAAAVKPELDDLCAACPELRPKIAELLRRLRIADRVLNMRHAGTFTTRAGFPL